MIYLDNAATTWMDNRVVDAMRPYMEDKYLNPSSSYAIETRKVLDDARARIAAFVGCDPSGVIFTSGGTEADNLAIAGTVQKVFLDTGKKPQIITSSIEHKAVLETCRFLNALPGAYTYYLPVDNAGLIDPAEVTHRLELNQGVTLVSIMALNNEIGTVEPIEEIAQICNACDYPVLFHTDAVQAIHYKRFNMKNSGIDMLSLSAHKFSGPKGVGALCVSDRAMEALSPILHGGHQQNGFRPGTENVAGIVGMAKAIELLEKEWDVRHDVVAELDRMMRDKLMQIPDIRFNGDGTPGYINVSFKDVDAETLLIFLQRDGVYASSGSACNEGIVDTSHVLSAINVPEDYIDGTIRFTLGDMNTMPQIMEACDIVRKNVQFIRQSQSC